MDSEQGLLQTLYEGLEELASCHCPQNSASNF